MFSSAEHSGAEAPPASAASPEGKDASTGKVKGGKGARAEVVADRFKTKLCTKWLEAGRCPYDSRCMFAHGENELRTTAMNVRDGLTTEESIWRFKKTGVLGSHRSVSHPPERHVHPSGTPQPATPSMHTVGGPFPLHHPGAQMVHVPHVAMPGLVPMTPHYMPYMTHGNLHTAVHGPTMGPVLSLFPPMHSFAYSTPTSPLVYVVDPSSHTFSGMFSRSPTMGPDGGGAAPHAVTEPR